jgi:anthranilate phosphoribosyltransferase
LPWLEGVERAIDSIDSGKAQAALDRLVANSQTAG